MAQASRQVRKIRRIKRERSQAFRIMEVALAQRDYARAVAFALTQELKKRDEADAAAKAEIKSEETPVEQDHQVSGQN